MLAVRNDFLTLVPLMLLALGAGTISLWYQENRCRTILQDWASQNFLQLQHVKMCIFPGPFWLRSSKGQVVCRFAVLDTDGQSYTGWARCGSYWWGLWSDDVEIIWRSPAPAAFRAND